MVMVCASTHIKRRNECRECDPVGNLVGITRSTLYQAVAQNKPLPRSGIVGCSTAEFKEHLQSKFQEGMGWENYGEWQIDHIIPLKYKKDNATPTIEEVTERFHYLNTQPMWAAENGSKGNRFIGRSPIDQRSQEL
jgi:hypothetical protein